MRFVIEEQTLQGIFGTGLDLLGKTLVVPSPSGFGVAGDIANAIVKATKAGKPGRSFRTRLPGAGYVEVDLVDSALPAATNTLATYRCRIEGEDHDPDVFTLPECFVMWHGRDEDGEPTGKPVKVQVTHARIDPDGDTVGDPPRIVDCSSYFIDQAHSDETGEAIPREELSEIEAITSECLNVRWLSPEAEEYLDECIQSRAGDIARHEAGC